MNNNYTFYYIPVSNAQYKRVTNSTIGVVAELRLTILQCTETSQPHELILLSLLNCNTPQQQGQ